MITIRATAEEADVAGSPEELRQIHASIQRFVGSPDRSLTIPADPAADPNPYAWSLGELRIVRDGDRARVSIHDRNVLVISGADENLIKFASWFDFAPDSKPGSHNHFEPLPGNKYVAIDSLPLVVSVSSEAQQRAASDVRNARA